VFSYTGNHLIIIRDRIDQGMHEEKPLPAVCAEAWQTDVVSSTAAGLFFSHHL
jgi:hypothetical protein